MYYLIVELLVWSYKMLRVQITLHVVVGEEFRLNVFDNLGIPVLISINIVE